jgi:PAS domain S-box-containing protein
MLTALARIKAQQAAADAIRESEARYSNLVATLQQVVFQIDREGRFTFLNPAWTRIMGYSVEETLGQPHFTYVHPEDRARHHNLMQRAAEGGAIANYEIRCIAQNGEEKWLEGHVSLSRDVNGDIAGCSGTLTDVTGRHRAAEALRASEARYAEQSALLKDSVAGTASLLLKTELSKEQRRYVETIQECSDTLLELIGDILDFSKLDTGGLELKVSEFNLLEVTETVLHIVEPRARRKDLLVVFSPSPELPARLTGDPGRLRQVLLHLIGDAIKFAESGSVVLRTFPKDTEKGRFVRFEVENTGTCIPENSRERLFQEFSQVEAFVATAIGGRIGVESRVGDGSIVWFELPLQAADPAARERREGALGAGRRVLLAAPCGPGRDAASELLASHGFEVVDPDMTGSDEVDIALLHHSVLPAAPFRRRSGTAESPKPWIAFGFGASRWNGSVDAVIDGALKPSDLAEVLAKILEDASPIKSTAKARPQPEAAARKLRILLVEAHHINQRIAASILKNMGHEVELAADGCEAVAQAEGRPYDLIFMDVQMPRMDGLQATRVIRGLSGDAAQVPIVAMTANVCSSDRDACSAAGMNDFVSKPVNREKFFNILERWGEAGRARPQGDAASSANVAGPLDRTQLDALREELGDDILGELLTSFRASAADLLRRIHAAIGAQDRAAADELVHRLKGSAATLSFGCVAEACEQLRECLHAAGPLDVGDALPILLKSLRESEDFMRSEMKQAQAAA